MSFLVDGGISVRSEPVGRVRRQHGYRALRIGWCAFSPAAASKSAQSEGIAAGLEEADNWLRLPAFRGISVHRAIPHG
jgi:hypothetical protein